MYMKCHNRTRHNLEFFEKFLSQSKLCVHRFGMNQRLHGTQNCTNMDTINCQSYETKLNKPKRNIVKSRDSSQTGVGRQPIMPGRIVPTINLPSVSNLNPRNAVSRQTNAEELIPSNIIRKEIYDAACVEVTVKTHGVPPPQRPKSRMKSSTTVPELSWGKLLKSESSIDNVASQCSQFRDFDPLRTLHFLAKELQSRLSDTAPGDNAIQQMVADMQMALNRVPPEVANAIMDPGVVTGKRSNYLIKGNKKSNTGPMYRDHMEPEKLVTSVALIPKSESVEKAVQTTKGINYAETEKLQKHLEESTEKIEVFCKQMEQVCVQLKSDKEQVENLLEKERLTVGELRKRIIELEQQQVDRLNTISSLSREKEDLQLDLRRLKLNMEAETTSIVEHFKSEMEKWRDQKNKADEKIIDLEHQLTNMTMNKEKYEAMLSARDKQVVEIQNEMIHLQKLVNDHIEEYNNPNLSGVASSASMISERAVSSMILNRKIMNDIRGDFADINTNPSASTVKETEKTMSLKELPSCGDSSLTSTNIWTKFKQHSNKKPKSKFLSDVGAITGGGGGGSNPHDNIRDMFLHIKNTAMHMPENSHTDVNGLKTDEFPSEVTTNMERL